MGENSRESRRRRRILEQGSDRLAFITSRTQSLPPPPDPASSSQSLASVLPRGEEAEEECDSVLPVATDPHDSDASKTITLTQHEAESEISSEVEHAEPPLPDSSLSIIPSEISSAINASRGTRLCCSAAVALLVVASYLAFSLLGTEFMKTVISFRPLYLVLLTNLTLVLARLLSTKTRRQNQTDDGDQWGAQLARTLELGLLMKNMVDAVFMDCAVYAILVVCGLSLVNYVSPSPFF